MNTDLISKVENKFSRKDLPNFKVGDVISVGTIIREGDKKRIQKFQGLVIAITGPKSREMFTVRKISYGVGIEKTFPLNSTNISSIEVVKSGKARRAKLYYIRDRFGKLALKVKPGRPAPVIEHADDEGAVVSDEVETEEIQAENEEMEVVAEVDASEAEAA